MLKTIKSVPDRNCRTLFKRSAMDLHQSSSQTEKLPPNPPAAFAPIPVMQGPLDQRQPAHPSCAASCEAEMPWCITNMSLNHKSNHRIYLHEVLKRTVTATATSCKFHLSHPQMVGENIYEVPTDDSICFHLLLYLGFLTVNIIYQFIC